jgi:cell wall-associated NlpC family hydrolase
MARDIRVPIIGDPASFERSLKTASNAAKVFSTDMSDAQIKVAVAQKRLEESTKRYGEGSVQAAQQTLRLRSAQKELVAETSHLSTQLDKSHGHFQHLHRDLESGVRGALAGSGAFKEFRKQLLFASTAFLSTAGFVDVAHKALQASDNLAHQNERTSETFKADAAAVKAWSRNSADSMGLSRAAALDHANTLGTLFKNMGLVGGQSKNMSTNLVQSAANVAAVKRTTTDAPLAAFEAAMAGRTRGLKQYGIVVDATSVKAEAMRMGFVAAAVDSGKVKRAQEEVAIATAKAQHALDKYGAGTTQAASAQLTLERAQAALKKATDGHVGSLTAAQKALATYSLIMNQTRDYQGKFKNSTNDLEVQQQRLKAHITNVEAEIGNGLRPILLQILDPLNNWLQKSEQTGKMQEYLRTASHDLHATLNLLIAVVKFLSGSFEALNDITGSTKHSIELLGTAALVFKARGAVALIAGLTGIGKAAGEAGAAGEVGLLASRLTMLARMGPITIPILLSMITGATNPFGGHPQNFQGTGGQNIVQQDGKFYVRAGGRALKEISADDAYKMMGYTTAPGGAGALSALTAGGIASSNSSGRQKLLDLAKSAIGTPYVWGGAGPGGMDCSGLVSWALGNGLNVNLGRTTTQMFGKGSMTTNPKPGDLVFTNFQNGQPQHMGIYAGNGQVYASEGAGPSNTAAHPGPGVMKLSLGAFQVGGQLVFQSLDGPRSTTPATLTGPPKADTTPATNLHVGSTVKKPSIVRGDALFSQALRDAISGDADKAKNASGSAAVVWLRRELHDIELARAEVEKQLKGASGKQADAIRAEVTKLDNKARDVHTAIKDALFPAQLTKLLSPLTAKIKGLALNAADAELAAKNASSVQLGVDGHKTSDGGLAQYQLAAKYFNQEEDALEKARALLQSKLAGADKAQRSAITSQIGKIDTSLKSVASSIISNLQSQVNALQSKVSAAQSAVSSAFSAISSEIITKFQKQTQAYIDSLGISFYQGGAQTPLEKKFAELQATDQLAGLQDAATAALQTADPKQIAAAVRAIDMYKLQIEAAKERAQADKDYAAAVKTYTDERSVLEQELNASLTRFGNGLQDGTVALSDLQSMLNGANVYGVNFGITLSELSSANAFVKQEFTDLAIATQLLRDAMDDLKRKIDELSGASSGSGTGSGGSNGNTNSSTVGSVRATNNGTAQTISTQSGATATLHTLADGTSYLTMGRLTALAEGGVVRRPTLALIGEAGPEAVVPLGRGGIGGSGSIELHLHIGSVIGNDLENAGKQLADPIRRELLRVARRTGSSGIT